MARFRERLLQPYHNELFHNGSLVEDTTSYAYHETCSDVLSPKTDNPLTLSKDRLVDGGYYTSTASSGSTTHANRIGVTSTDLSGLGDSAIDSWLGQFTAQKVAAATAPLKPSVYNLTNLLEFRDIPHMLKHAGDLLHKLRHMPHRLLTPNELAEATLAYQFGWRPLLDDLLRMADFGRAVQQRQREIGALNSGKTISRRVKFGSTGGGTKTGTTTLHSTSGVNISAPYNGSWTASAWATIRWKLADMNQLGRVPTWWSAFNSLYGLTPGEIPIQIWKALPWSWAIDWFANISDALEVSKNLCTYSPSRINLMWTSTYQVTYQPVNTSTVKFQGASRVRTIKNRKQLSTSAVTGIHLHVPFLDTFKLSVLSSLTVVKLRRRFS